MSASNIAKRDIVKHGGEFYRVSRRTKNTVNLSGVFTSVVYHKGVPVAAVAEASEEFHDWWSQTESYKSM